MSLTFQKVRANSNLRMLRNKKRVRADSGEVLEYSIPLPRAQPRPTVEYTVFQPAPALPKDAPPQSGAVGSDSKAASEDPEKTRVQFLLSRFRKKIVDSLYRGQNLQNSIRRKLRRLLVS